MIREVLTETEDRMTKSVDALEEDLKGIRTGRASPALVERLRVDYYGSPTNLIELASVSAPEPQLLTINPYDPGALKDIERAILDKDARIGRGVTIRSHVGEADRDEEQYAIRDGIVVVPKSAVIPDGTII